MVRKSRAVANGPLDAIAGSFEVLLLLSPLPQPAKLKKTINACQREQRDDADGDEDGEKIHTHISQQSYHT